MSVVGDVAATSDGASGNDMFSLYVCYLDDSDRSNISRRPTPFPTFSAM